MPNIVRPYRSRPLATARKGNLLVGCLAVLGVVAVLVVVGGVIVWMNWKGWTASAMNATMKALVAETDLPAEQMGRMNTQIDQLTTAFENGDVTFEDLGKVAQALESHPILPVGMLEYVEANQLSIAGLTDEERAAGALATQRLQRAMIDKQMTMTDLEPVLEPISQRDADGDLELLQNPTVPQVKLYIEAATSKADELGILSEPYAVDIAEQFERLINDTLGREVVSAPAAGAAALPPAGDDQGEDAGSDPVEDPGPVEDPTGGG